ncbi:MAG: GWxTD domain-containing protein [Bacteroidetes bacterium]|uniref:GWxTD domain-containing protein n=1 Tax=Flavobacterium filum TaxID=370974 RepID=UPI0023F3C8A8|nr:GWxTD domain-containing protein [Flavobacterium filum]MCA0429376.1 GWxTD domain-containing protein [Bacteroidota bacterium]
MFLKLRHIILSIFILSTPIYRAQLVAYYSSTNFNTPQNKPYLDCNITFIASSLASKKTNNGFQQSLQIIQKIYNDTLLIKANKYTLNGPFFADSLNKPNFIDYQRYNLQNGYYVVETEIKDLNDKNSKTITIKENIKINYIPNQINISGLQLLESYKPSTKNTIITKSGFDLIPYTINYYPETQKQIAFYAEIYNTDSILGVNKNFIVTYFIESNFNFQKIEGYGGFKKYTTSSVNPILTKLDLSLLKSGNYNLVLEVRDDKNILQAQQKIYFSRLNKKADLVAVYEWQNKKTVADYFGVCDNADTLKMFTECLWPIANNLDKDRVINAANSKNKDLMKNYIIDFWERYAADTANPLKLWSNYYKEVQKVMVLFKCGKQPGYYTDRGRVYLQYGAPNQRSQQIAEQNTFPYEIWQYYRLNDKATGAFFSNKKFVFVNKQLADDCYNIVHSDVRGEIYNDRWKFELTRRNNNGIANPDNTTPVGTETNHFDEIYSNPR